MAKKKSKAGKPAKRAKQKVSGKKVSRKAAKRAVAAAIRFPLAAKTLRAAAGKSSPLVKVRRETEGLSSNRTNRIDQRQEIRFVSDDGKTVIPSELDRAKAATFAKTAAEEDKLPAFKLLDLPVESIQDPAKGGRMSMTEADEEALAELSRSIERTGGVLQPIGVHQAGGKRTVIWGSRRLAATKMGELKKIACKVYQDLTPAQVEKLRSIENVQRKQWTLVEESMAVKRMYDKTPLGTEGRDTQKARCEEVARKMGTSEPWVLDRLHISRLDGGARDLVGEGRLSLQHAREISTIADPSLRNEIARQASRRKDGSGGMPYDQVARWCRENRLSLKTASWNLNVEVGGKCACDTCPSNTNNDATLYSHDPREAKLVAENGGPKGTCMNRHCFEHKRRAVDKAIDSGLAKAREAIKDKKLDKKEITATTLNDAGVMPKVVKETTFVRAAKVELERGGAATATRKEKDEPSAAQQEESAEELATQRWEDANENWAREAKKLIAPGLAAKPGRIICLAFAMACIRRIDDLDSRWGGKDELVRIEKIVQSPDMKKLLQMVADGDAGKFREWEEQIGRAMASGDRGSKAVKYGVIGEIDRWANPVLVTFGEACGVKLPPAPDLAVFVAEEKAKLEKKSPAKAGKD